MSLPIWFLVLFRMALRINKTRMVKIALKNKEICVGLAFRRNIEATTHQQLSGTSTVMRNIVRGLIILVR